MSVYLVNFVRIVLVQSLKSITLGNSNNRLFDCIVISSIIYFDLRSTQTTFKKVKWKSLSVRHHLIEVKKCHLMWQFVFYFANHFSDSIRLILIETRKRDKEFSCLNEERMKRWRATTTRETLKVCFSSPSFFPAWRR